MGLSLFFSVIFLAFAPLVQANDLMQAKPDWAKSNYRADSGLDFIGLSQLWIPTQAQAEAKSISEACTNGLGKVSEYFSVEIASKTTSSQVVVNEEFQGRFHVNTDKVSRINLSGVSVTASYSELVQDGAYLQSYCLYRLSHSQVKQIKADLAKEQAQINALIADFAEQINQQNVTQARIKLAQLKSQPNISLPLLIELEALLAQVAKGLMSVDLVFAQHTFTTNDALALQLQANQNTYVYLFIDEGRHTSMIMPSPGDGFNRVKKDVAFHIPSKQQTRKGNVFRIPKLNQLQTPPQVYLVASKKRLLTQFAKPAFNRFIVSDKTKFNDFLNKCRLQEDCLVNQYPVLLESGKMNVAIESYQLNVNNQVEEGLNQYLDSQLKKMGFDFTSKGALLNIEIKHKKRFSKKLDSQMFVAELRITQLHDGEVRGLVKLRYSNLYDENRTQDYLESMLTKASKKLMEKAQNGALSN